jgi:hypothetical protein
VTDAPWGTKTQQWGIGHGGAPAAICCGLQPTTFICTIYYADDHGNALSSSAQVPIQ